MDEPSRKPEPPRFSPFTDDYNSCEPETAAFAMFGILDDLTISTDEAKSVLSSLAKSPYGFCYCIRMFPWNLWTCSTGVAGRLLRPVRPPVRTFCNNWFR